MTIDAWITVAAVAGVLAALIRELVPPSAALMSAVVVLLLAGVLPVREAFGGFANPATITIAALYVVARAVRESGAVGQLVTRLLDRGRSERGVLLRLVAPVGLTSGFLNNTPLVATLAPLVSEWAEGRRESPARYLMPLSFAAILGGMVTTIGTSTTLVASGLLEEWQGRALHLFEVTPVGLPVAVLGAASVILLAPRLLPDRPSPAQQVATHDREYTFRMRVDGGALSGRSVADAGLRNLAGVYLARIDRAEHAVAPVGPTEVLHEGDELVFVGNVDQVRDLQQRAGLVSAEAEHAEVLDSSGGQRFFEVVLGASSPLGGRTLKEVGFRARYDAAVMAVHRAGERVSGKLGSVRLRVGDVLLLLADPAFARRWRDSRDFLLVADLGAHAPPIARRPVTVLLIVAGMLVVAATGMRPIVDAALGAVLLLLATRALTLNEAREAVDVDVVVLVAGAIGLGTAVERSGLADLLAGSLTAVAAVTGGLGALAALLLVTLVLTEIVTNVAAIALVLPLALQVAGEVGADPRAFAIGTTIMASASFLTPLGYQTNTMVYGLGGYRYTDYVRLGLPVTAVALVTILVGVHTAW